MLRRTWFLMGWMVMMLAVASLACSLGLKASPTPAPTPTAQVAPTARPTQKPTAVPTRLSPTRTPAQTAQASFTNLVFASQVISDSEGLYAVDPAITFFDISEINAVWDYEGTQDGADFRRVWYRDGEVVLDKTDSWDGGESGTYHLAIAVDSGVFAPGLYALELYYAGDLLLSDEFLVLGAPPPSGTILYEDDFADRASGWDIDDNEESTVDYIGGRYVILVKSARWLAWANPLSGLDVQDAIIEVDAKLESGPWDDLAEFGIICRYLDANNFYYFMVRADGLAAIFKVEDDDQTLISAADDQYTPAPAIQTGTTWNHLRVMCIGDRLELYVNEERVAQAVDATFTGGNVGLIAGTFDEGNIQVIFERAAVEKQIRQRCGEE